jgi:hypothetical protein
VGHLLIFNQKARNILIVYANNNRKGGIMKKVILIILCVLAVLLTACSDTDKDAVPELVIPSPATSPTAAQTNGIGGFDAFSVSPSPVQ